VSGVSCAAIPSPAMCNAQQGRAECVRGDGLHNVQGMGIVHNVQGMGIVHNVQGVGHGDSIRDSPMGGRRSESKSNPACEEVLTR
jgi:hypothetical protein